jgi:anthranilate synthase component 1
MIHSKKIQTIELSHNQNEDLRSRAFGIYLELLKKYRSDELLLLESLGSNSIDSRVSLIGICPTLTIAISDCIITFRGNELLLEEIATLYVDEACSKSDIGVLEYQIANRKQIWDFIRKIDHQFKLVQGGVLAFMTMAYQMIHYIEDLATYGADMPADITLTCFSACLEFGEQEVTLHDYDFIGAHSVSKADLVEALIVNDSHKMNSLSSKTLPSFTIECETSREAYIEKANRALHHIQIGDIYQVQIGQKVRINSTATPLEVYSRMRLLNPSPYMYLFNVQGRTVIGASPELFVRVQDGEVLMRPIAGTLGKSATTTKALAKTELQNNAKEVAEHLMLVDLCRNDLSRIAISGSLTVLDLLDVEEYSHVYHMVTTSRVHMKGEFDKYDVIKACFPAGTMTGTPKIRAMEIIADLEDSDRGLYAGALGMIGLGADFVNTALCIRTAIECDGVYTLRASAGIVADSDADKEHAETLHKMGSVFKAITGEEIACHLA